MYKQYLSMPAIPAGAILERILNKEEISQKEIAEKTDIFPQRINDLISGKRNFTPDMSLRLEKALGIRYAGYFYKIQANNIIYLYQEEQEQKDTPDLAILHKSLFWETPIENINWKKNINWIVQRVFEYGNRKDIEEIINYYGREKVKKTLDTIPKKDTWKLKERNKNRKIFKI